MPRDARHPERHPRSPARGAPSSRGSYGLGVGSDGGDGGGGEGVGGGNGGGGNGAVLVHALSGPSVEVEPSIRAYAPNQAVAPENMLSNPMICAELTSHAEMSALNAVAPRNMSFKSKAELTSHAEMSALNDVAPRNM